MSLRRESLRSHLKSVGILLLLGVGNVRSFDRVDTVLVYIGSVHLRMDNTVIVIFLLLHHILSRRVGSKEP